MDERNNHFDFDFTPIGQAIKKAREARGMTREQLSGIIGYAPRHIQSIKNEGQYPIGGNLRKIYTKKSGNIHVFSKLCSQLQKNKFTRFSFWYKISLPTNFTKRGVL